jgi:hypothetical protein
MKVLAEQPCKRKIVETKTWAKLIMIEEEPNHFWLEQNPLKDSKYWIAYRKLKQIYPDLYLFWEIKDNEFTWKLKLEMISDKKLMDQMISDLLHSDEYKNYQDTNELP